MFRQAAPYLGAFRGQTFVIALDFPFFISEESKNTLADLRVLTDVGVRVVLVFGSPNLEHRQLMPLALEDFHSYLAEIHRVGLLLENRLSRVYSATRSFHERQKVLRGNFVTAQPVGVVDGVDWGYAGEVRKIDFDGIRDALNHNALVLVSGLGHAMLGDALALDSNVLAARLAEGLAADKLIYLTDDMHEGQDSLMRSDMSQSDARLLSTSPDHPLRHILAQAASCLNNGVKRVHLLSPFVPGTLLLELFTREGCGSMISANSSSDQLRPARLSDLPDLLELIHPFEQSGLLVIRDRLLIEREIDNYLVFEHEGLIVGTVAVFDHGQGHAEIASLAVDATVQDNGIGRRLLEAAEKRARDLKAHTAFALTTRSTDWFAAHGYALAAVSDLPTARQKLYNWQRRSKVMLKTLA